MIIYKIAWYYQIKKDHHTCCQQVNRLKELVSIVTVHRYTDVIFSQVPQVLANKYIKKKNQNA